MTKLIHRRTKAEYQVNSKDNEYIYCTVIKPGNKPGIKPGNKRKVLIYGVDFCFIVE